ncbi:MAG: ABC transporter permease [Clostridium sp.]|nr:ABC transporter permease [Acetatifactor muris]MCM1527539.1 ABC transporter permease [Bacteroides sp.]MCM1563781.1 ABC transporter permease [Clostridium sp.]
MIISLKDLWKMIGITIVSFCAVFVCALFLNYRMDLVGIEPLITTEIAQIFYEAQRNTATVVCAVSGGCLLLTTVVLLCFYVGHYIDTHKKQLGILKALGYSNTSVAKGFAIFGLPVLAGTALGFVCALFFMPLFYEVQNEDGYLPAFDITFHPSLSVALIGLPTLFFALLAVGYSLYRLRVSALTLMRETTAFKPVRARKDSDLPFLQELQKSNVRQRKSLIFFITFAVFCFAAMVQMSCSMDELASPLMAAMILTIGVVLACVTLLIAITSVVKANGKTITMMKVFGYEAGECARIVLGGYRPWAYLGFALGSVYQYVLLKIAVTVIFADMDNMPEYGFDFPVMLLTLAAFVLLYETVMWICTRRMEKLSVKEIMAE